MLNNRNAMLAGLLANRGRMQPTSRSSMGMLQQSRMAQQPRSPWQTQSIPGYGAFGGLPNPYSMLTPQTSMSAASYLPKGTSASLSIDPATLVPQEYTPPSVSGASDTGTTGEPETEVFAIYGTPITASSYDEAYDIWLNQYRPGGLEG